MLHLRSAVRKLLAVDLTPLQIHAFRVYSRAMREWPRNVTSILRPAEIEVKHFADSLLGIQSLRACLPHRHPILNSFRPNGKPIAEPERPAAAAAAGGIKHSLALIDIASGAGFPALPLYLLFGPHAAATTGAAAGGGGFGGLGIEINRLTLCDSQLQKCKFLDFVCNRLSAIDESDVATAAAAADAASDDASVEPLTAAAIAAIEAAPRVTPKRPAFNFRNVSIVQKRAEDLHRFPEHSHQYDWAVVRALSPDVTKLLSLTVPFLRAPPRHRPATAATAATATSNSAAATSNAPASDRIWIGGITTLYKGANFTRELLVGVPTLAAAIADATPAPAATASTTAAAPAAAATAGGSIAAALESTLAASSAVRNARFADAVSASAMATADPTNLTPEQRTARAKVAADARALRAFARQWRIAHVDTTLLTLDPAPPATPAGTTTDAADTTNAAAPTDATAAAAAVPYGRCMLSFATTSATAPIPSPLVPKQM